MTDDEMAAARQHTQAELDAAAAGRPLTYAETLDVLRSFVKVGAVLPPDIVVPSTFASPPNNAPEEIRINALLQKRALGITLTSGEESLLLDFFAYISRLDFIAAAARFTELQAKSEQGLAKTRV